MKSRENKIEARKRGALSRQLSTAALIIGSPKLGSRNGTPKSTRLEMRSSITPNRGSSLIRDTPDYIPMLSPKRVSRTPKVIYTPPNRTRERKPSLGKENRSPIEVTPKEPPRRVGRPRKSSIRQESKPTRGRKSITKTPKGVRKVNTTPKLMLRKSKRTPKPISKLNYSDVEEEPDISDLDEDYKANEDDDGDPRGDDIEVEDIAVKREVTGRVKYKTKKQPLSRPELENKKFKSSTHASKLIEIKLERLSYTPNGVSKKTISTLDVLSQVVNEYISSSQPTKPLKLDRKLLQLYATKISDHFTRLIDVSLNNETLSKELVLSNKEKELLRKKIYQVRKKHDELVMNLEKLRSNYKLKKQVYESNLEIADSFKAIKSNDGSVGLKNSLADKIGLQMIKLDKLTNPKTGILDKLEQLNESLMNIDAGN